MMVPMHAKASRINRYTYTRAAYTGGPGHASRVSEASQLYHWPQPISSPIGPPRGSLLARGPCHEGGRERRPRGREATRSRGHEGGRSRGSRFAGPLRCARGRRPLGREGAAAGGATRPGRVWWAARALTASCARARAGHYNSGWNGNPEALHRVETFVCHPRATRMMVICSPLSGFLVLWSSHCRAKNRAARDDSADPFYQH